MIEYDATLNAVKPSFDTDPTKRVIRTIYDYRGYISVLYGVHTHAGVELSLAARSGAQATTTIFSRHAHISILTQNPIPYATLFNTKRFYFRYLKLDRDDFLRQRFPTWNLVGHDEIGYPEMELCIE